MKDFIECAVYYDEPIAFETFEDDPWSDEGRDKLAEENFLDAKNYTIDHLTDLYSSHSSSEDFWNLDWNKLRIECKQIPPRR